MPPRKKEISLLPEEEKIDSLTARALHWLSTVGRVIIIFTELLVISAFVSRFWLDRKNSDLSEIIRQRKAILKTTQQFETELALVQRKVEVVKKTIDTQPAYDRKITALTRSTPPEISYQLLSLAHDSEKNRLTASISFYAYTENSLVDFISNLAVNPEVASLEIKSITKPKKDPRYQTELDIVFGV